MASIYDLKPAFQNLLRPVCRLLVRAGCTANQVTIAAVVLSCVTGMCIAIRPDLRWPLLLLPATLFVRMALNAIDGMMAREHDMKSPLGAILNELGDVVSDTVLYLPLALVPGVRGALVVSAAVAAVIAEMTGVVAVQIGASRRYDGPMGKSDRAFVFGTVGLVLGLGFDPQPWFDFVMGGVLLLLALTIVNRARRALDEVAG